MNRRQWLFEAKAGATAFVVGAVGGAAVTDVAGRDTFPEPFDVGDHAGNLFGSILYPLILCSFSLSDANPLDRQARDKAFKVGAIGNGLINLVFETRWGDRLVEMSHLFTNNVPDVIDGVYGTLYGTVAAYVISRTFPE